MIKKQLIYPIVLFIFLNAPLMGQVEMKWERNLGGSPGDNASFIQQTSDGDNLIAGYSYTSNINLSDHNSLPDRWMVNLHPDPPRTLTLDAEICDGSSYILGSQILTKTGIYTETFTSSIGSDSIVTVNLTVLPHVTETIDWKICDGDSYTLGSQVLTTSGTYTDTLTASNSCDSIVTVNLTVIPILTDTLNVTIFESETYNGNFSITFGGTSTETFTSSLGCDSIVTVNLTVVPSLLDNKTYFADSTAIDAQGFTHYFQTDDHPGTDTLLLSIAKNNQDIGTIGDGVFEVRVGRNPGTVDLTALIRDKAPELGSIDTAIALDYFWQVVPNYTGELDTTVGLSFHFPVDDVSKLEAALGTELSATDLFFFKASGNVGEEPFLDIGSGPDLQFKVYQNGALPSTSEWQLIARGSNTLVGTMDLDGFSWGGIFAIRQVTPVREALALTQFSLSPNPSTGILQLRFASPNKENLQLQVSNALGEPLYQQQLLIEGGDNQVELSLEKLPAGLYFLLLQNERGERMSRKFFIQN